jgi:THO complex subunit 1
MVETVLSRDKNWVRWKMENCPSIAKPAVSSDEYLAAKVAAKKATANKRIRPHPMASLDLKFLIEAEGSGGMEKLKTSRYRIPTLEDFRRKIADDDFEIEMPASDESKQMAVNGKASKSWRALRIASKTNLAKFDKIDDPEKIDIIFQEATATEEEQTKDEVETGDDNNTPTDRRPLIISGPGGVGKGTLIKILLEKHPNMFRKKSSHTTRAPREGEVDGVDYNFVDTETYNMMRDGDQFLEFNCLDGNDYGTSRKIVEGIVAAGKVPVMAMDYHVGAKFTLAINISY